ncbi:AMP-binding protein [Parabacteroides sp. PF5-9]|uniref:AMP-dependent synthetase/ligase n=1 Tax=Parabacteroides sp. PF5-9 TaxID=1742404 RepID=UPI002476CB58|nr:AMP-binding protein [Parabacteroides sp. PF5-9]MDH6358658.1 long-chain acyl-CoA synthetase [Parabacteroides sp. PF5-9]
MKKTLVDFFETSVSRYPDNPFLWEKTADQFEATTYTQVKEQVYALGAGLVALGVKKGDNMALLSEGRNAWIIGELAMFYAGATNVPLSIKLEEANDLLFRLLHADVKYLMVSGNQLKKIRGIMNQLPLVEKVIIFDEQANYEDKEIPLSTLIEMGKAYLETHPLDEFLKIGQSLQNDDYATITYTSGTTADPKGVVLTHRNYTANVEQALSCVDIDESWRTLIILPLDHCFAHVVGFYIFMHKGASVATVQVGKTGMETLKNIPINIKEFKPYLILSVPALAKNFKKNIEQGIRAKGKMAMRLYHLGLKIGYIYNGDGDDKGRGWRFILKPFITLFDTIIFSKIRENFGGELKFFIGGGALLDKDLQKFYYAIGLPMYQGYGLSEATPVISTNGPYRHKFGSSGVLVQPLDVKICDIEGKELPIGEKGEIVVRGENVMSGYWKNPVSTAETVRDGWLYTGDMGYMSQDGLLYVLGRFKSLLIGSDGEKYSPEGIEEALVEHSSTIDQIILYNNQNPYTVALIVPNKERLNRHLSHQHLDPDSIEGKEAALKVIQHQLDRFRKGGEFASMFPDRWLPAAFAVLPEAFTEQNGLVNSSLKIVRGKVETKYADRIDHLYTPEGKNPYNVKNIASI